MPKIESTIHITRRKCLQIEISFSFKLKLFYREEKSEQLAECREELEHTKLVLAKLRSDSQEWFNEARKAAAYRDEVDALREKAERCDRFVTNKQIEYEIIQMVKSN